MTPADSEGPDAAPRPIGHRVVRVAVTPSTMDDARRELDRLGPRAAHGVVVVAREQTAGRGTRGRAWITARDRTLPLTVIVAPQPPIARPALLTLATAAALVRAGEAVGACLQIRWPNDVVDLQRRKVAGILAQAIATSPKSYLVGVGVNVLPPGIADDALRDRVGSVRDAGGVVVRTDDFLRPLLDAMNHQYEQLMRLGPGSLREEFQRRSSQADVFDRYRRGDETVHARLIGLTDDLDLWLETGDGRRLIWSAEHVTRVHEDPPERAD